MESKKLVFIVPNECDGTTAKVFLRKHCMASARMIARLKREKCGILRNGEKLRTVDILNAGDCVELNLPKDNSNIKPVEGKLTILYEDAYIIVLNKQTDTPVHPTKIYQENTLANYLAFRQKQRGESYTFRAVNRLDKDTSGIVVVAKDAYTASFLFGNLKKTYIAVCEGVINEPGTIRKPIVLLEGHSVQRTVSEEGVPSITHYNPIKTNGKHTLTEFILETGHTHQIRCHMASIGHPLAGDDMYGGSLDYIKRQALHCNSVEFLHPIDGKVIKIRSDIPEDILKIMN